MIHRIESREDPRLHPYRHVGDPAWLRAERLFVAEGRLVVRRLLELHRFAVRSVLVTPPACDALQRELGAAPFDVYLCDQQTMNGITGIAFHRGCLGLAARPEPETAHRFSSARRVLGVEAVGNPDNVGGLFRAAAAFAVDGIVLDDASGDPLYRKSIRTSMGASLSLPFAQVPDWPAALQLFREAGCTIVALTPAEGAMPIADFAAGPAIDARLLLLVGAEGSGLAPETLAAADVQVRIPVARSVDSLNVVVAAGIALDRLRPRILLT